MKHRFLIKFKKMNKIYFSTKKKGKKTNNEKYKSMLRKKLILARNKSEFGNLC